MAILKNGQVISGGADSAKDITYDNSSSSFSSNVLQNVIDEIDANINSINSNISSLQGTILNATLSAGATELVIENEAITTNKMYEYYIEDAYNVCATNIVVETGKITMTFDAQDKDLNIRVVIK